ncbi:MAG: hypothetical protein M5U09_15790 [Gammaproteobacteria bacterium]|nr:hypothetical protein [Gammaproteobacteria bacterium]
MAERFAVDYLHPRHAGTWLLLALIGVTFLMPRRAALRLGAALGRLFHRRNPKRRAIARINIDFCFPDLDETARDALVLEHFEYYGRNVVDFGWRGGDLPRDSIAGCASRASRRSMQRIVKAVP